MMHSVTWLLLLAALTIIQANYTTKEGCELLLKDTGECECQDKYIKCGTLSFYSEELLNRIECGVFDARGFDFLPPLKAGNISELTISDCALPHQDTLKQLITSLGITNYTELEIQNVFERSEHRNDVLLQRYGNMPRLRSLFVTSFKKSLPANYLENCTELQKLVLHGSSDLPGRILHNLTELTNLNIVVRNIANVASEIFAKQSKLEVLSLTCGQVNNSADMSMLTSEVLWPLKQLVAIDLHNCGDNVPIELFWPLEELRYINIQSNISYLSKDFLKSQKNLIELHLQRNNIARLPDKIFWPTINMQIIELAYNNIDRIQSGLFDKVHNLQILNLEGNPITNIASDAFTNVPITRIYLGELYKQIDGKDWIKNSNATFCYEEYNYGVCIYCKRAEYLDHFADKETCNKPNDPGKLVDILRAKYRELLLNLSSIAFE